MVPTDSLEAAVQRELRFSDARLKQLWDPDRIYGSLMSKTLNLRISIAWDVYLLYLPEHPWKTGLPPVPNFWMHQQDEEVSLYLDPIRFKHSVQVALEKTVFQ